MNPGSCTTHAAACALVILAVCLTGFTRPVHESTRAPKERAPLGAGSLPSKASERSGDAGPGFHSAAATEAELSIRRWLDSLAGHPENLKEPPLEACKELSARAAEGFLRDPDHGWSPLLDVSRYAYLTNWEALLPFHKALLERWAELDAGALLLKLPPPDDQDKAMAPVAAIFGKAIESIDASTASRVLDRWFDGIAMSNPSPAFRESSEKLMQAWTASDPAGSWQWLKEKSLMGSMMQGATRGYLLGLQHPDWPALMDEARELPVAGLFGAASPQNSFREEAIRVWGREDPLAALTVFESSSPLAGQPQKAANFDGAYSWWGEVNSPATIPAGLIAEWLGKDPELQTQLEAWQPGGVARDEVFAIIARDRKYSEEVRMAARSLIRDPDVLAKVDKAREFQLKPPFVSFGSAVIPSDAGELTEGEE